MDLPTISEKSWAEHGLSGLVIGALFLVVVIFIWVIVKRDDKFISSIKDQETRSTNFLDNVLTEERTERRISSREIKESNLRLADALTSLTIHISKSNQGEKIPE